MLKSLSISNYALIENQNISFNSGFSIITGETGAGKSILLGALSLILGQRADVSVLNDKNRNCIIEGVFDVSRYNLKQVFEDNEAEYDDSTVIRRVISVNGKSRAFINDVPVTLNSLKEIGTHLVDIHSQHNNLLLNDYEFQLLIVDVYARHQNLVSEYRNLFNTWRNKEKELATLSEQAAREKAEYDFFSFQYTELAENKLNANEQEELEQEYEQLSHTEELTAALGTIFNLLNNDEFSITGNLKLCRNQSRQIENFCKEASEYTNRLESALIDLVDLAAEIETKSSNLVFDPDRLTFVKQRLDLIYSLQQKHKVSSVAELLQIQDKLEIKLSNISSFDEQILALTQKLKQMKAELITLADKISVSRKSIIPDIQTQVESIIKELGMPHARFVVSCEKASDLGINGLDVIKFVFSANKQSELYDITKVASGGEVSRVMLALKSIISEAVALPTIVFDEIDTGVSGDIADKMGALIHRMSANIQVINITHLPQVAAKGDYHYFVYKNSNSNTTTTNIKLLTTEERVVEIAKMLSGKELTQAALTNAKVLLNAN